MDSRRPRLSRQSARHFVHAGRTAHGSHVPRAIRFDRFTSQALRNPRAHGELRAWICHFAARDTPNTNRRARRLGSSIDCPDVYQWHRTDWPEDGFTRAIVRCSNLRAPASDPEGTARFILEAMAGGDFLLAAEHTEPSELRRNRLAFDSLLSADSTNYLALRIFDIPSKAQLLRISDAEFTARLFTFQTLLRTDRSFLANVRGAQTLGFVSRGEDTAHVVFRWRLPRDSVQLRSADVFTMVRSGGRWWAQTMGNYSGIIQVLQEPMVRVPPPRMP